MALLPGYSLGRSVYESGNSIIYRGVAGDSGRKVYVKRLPEALPPPEKVARFRREFEMTRRLEGDGVIQAIELTRADGGLAIVVEDFGGVSLSEHLRQGELDLSAALEAGESAARALARVHAGHVVHKDVNLGNLVWNRETSTLKLIDFGISTELSREAPAMVGLNVLEGTLAYMSPEQTGRMNRALDYRSDLYSLGVCLYRLIAGRLPFRSSDPMELVHAHLAVPPEPLTDVVPGVPAVLSALVERLLEKAAENRYQSAASVARDLARCRQQLAASGTIADFELGQGDVAEVFAIPQKLYGRSAETALLLEAFDRVAQGAHEMVLVAGYSGVGKSALVQEVHKPIVSRRGHFVRGKFDQFSRNVPYASLIQAFAELVQQLLTEPGERLARWRQSILDAVGSNGQVVVDVLPAVELVIGAQPPVPELAPVESQNRFDLVFERFVRAFCGAGHPLTVFLDDLQWADAPSLRLIRRFMTDAETGHLLLIGAYRDNEVDPTHPLMLALNDMQTAGASVTTITLAPLGERHVTELLADTLHRGADEVGELTRICLAKTHGNPFFLNQFLRALYDGGALDIDAELGWSWAPAAIEAMAITDNVVDLMARKIRKLAPRTQGVLQLAACIGAAFDLHTLAVVNEASAADTADALWPGLDAGLVVPLGSDWKFRQEEDPDGAGHPAKIHYRWLHDRVQQAAYSLIPDDRRKAVHLTIGRLMLRDLDKDQQTDQLFGIVGHLNHGADSIEDDAERLHLARLNLEVSRRAFASSAYGPAAAFAEQGLALLTDEPWSVDYALARDLHTQAAAAWELVPDFDAMEGHCAEVVARATDVLDTVRVYETHSRGLQAQARVVEGLTVALECLERLGVVFPDPVLDVHVGEAVAAVTAAMGGRSVAELVDVAPTTDPLKVATIRVLASTISTAYIGAPALMPLVVAKCVELSATGDTGASSYGYLTYAIILIGALEQFEAGAAFGELGSAVVEKHQAKEYAARGHYIRDCYYYHWTRHLSVSFEGFSETYQLGLETGDLEFAGWALMMRAIQGFFLGRPLPEREAETSDYIDKCAAMGRSATQSYACALRQAILNLMGRGNPDPTLLIGDAFDESVSHPRFIENAEAFGVANDLILKLVLCFLFGRFEEGVELGREMAPQVGAIVGLVHVPILQLYDGLNRVEAAAITGDEDGTGLARAREALAALERYAVAGPENMTHKAELLRGRILWHEGDRDAAHRVLKAGVERARQHGFVQEEAVGLELMGRLWLEREEPEIAALWLGRARHAYALWGAEAKVAALESTYGDAVRAKPKPVDAFQQPTVTSTTMSGVLDLAAVLRASQAIGSEVRLGALLETLMKTMIENAGATGGLLFLNREGELDLVAQAVAGESVRTLADDPSLGSEAHSAAQTVIAWVSRTGEAVVLDDTAEAGPFTGDPGLAGARSVLASPILLGGRTVAILYLENALATGAFTSDRLAVLDMLSRQVAVSIENARLFEEQRQLADSFARFVPRQFLQHLGRSSILEVELGDAVQRDIAVLFSDLRSFTALSEQLSPGENLGLLNRYLEVVEPAIESAGGFIDKYIGDAIMALFPSGPDDAVAAAVAMQRALAEHNHREVAAGRSPLVMGIGVHFGPVILGTMGTRSRMETTVIGDTVNLASRLEAATKKLSSGLIISEQTWAKLADPDRWHTRRAGRIRMKGKAAPVLVFDVLEAGQNAEARLSALESFEAGLDQYADRRFAMAAGSFGQCLGADPTDQLARLLAARCARLLVEGVPEGWSAEELILAGESKVG